VPFRLQGDTTKAIEEYKKAIDIDPNDGIAHISLASCYKKLGMDLEFREELKIAEKLAGNQTEYNRACLAAIKGDVDEAIKLLEIALSKKDIPKNMLPKDPDFEYIRNDQKFKNFLIKA
jgi:Flp pilus assembly protein TadD